MNLARVQTDVNSILLADITSDPTSNGLLQNIVNYLAGAAAIGGLGFFLWGVAKAYIAKTKEGKGDFKAKDAFEHIWGLILFEVCVAAVWTIATIAQQVWEAIRSGTGA